LAHLFRPYYRVRSVRRREGLGLGLFIASQIAEAHSGTLTVRSDAGGTAFTLRMPASA
jgi:signal transduction histidine kinase